MTDFEKQIEDILNNVDQSTLDTFMESGFDPESKWVDEDVTDFYLKVLSPESIEVEHIDNYGGEGEGETYWSVYKFTKDKNECYVKFNGFYTSYNGAEYQDFNIVKPKEKLITVYE